MRIRSLETLEVHRCPFCGLRVVGNPDKCTFVHEEPPCSGFNAFLLKMGFRMVATEATVYLAPKKDAAS
jgi:hypothetical protein